MVETTYGSTDSGDSDHDPELSRIKAKYKDKPVSLQSALIQYSLKKVLGSQPAAPEDSPNPTDEPPPEVLVELGSRRQKLLRYLWTHPEVTYEELHQTVWSDKDVEDNTIVQTANRLGVKLFKLGYGDWRVEAKGGYVRFTR